MALIKDEPGFLMGIFTDFIISCFLQDHFGFQNNKTFISCLLLQILSLLPNLQVRSALSCLMFLAMPLGFLFLSLCLLPAPPQAFCHHIVWSLCCVWYFPYCFKATSKRKGWNLYANILNWEILSWTFRLLVSPYRTLKMERTC